MADQVLANAIQALTTPLANLLHAAPAQEQQLVHSNTLDPFASDLPFDLTSRSGSQAFNTASAALEETWDGTIHTFPSILITFVCELLKSRGMNLPHAVSSPTPTMYQPYNLFIDHHSIPTATLELAHVEHVNDHAIRWIRNVHFP